jgi:hypothetical protein
MAHASALNVLKLSILSLSLLSLALMLRLYATLAQTWQRLRRT